MSYIQLFVRKGKSSDYYEWVITDYESSGMAWSPVFTGSADEMMYKWQVNLRDYPLLYVYIYLSDRIIKESVFVKFNCEAFNLNNELIANCTMDKFQECNSPFLLRCPIIKDPSKYHLKSITKMYLNLKLSREILVIVFLKVRKQLITSQLQKFSKTNLKFIKQF